MAANFLGLYFLILGTAGLSNAISLQEVIDWNKKMDHGQYNHFHVRNNRYRFGAPCHFKYTYMPCKNVFLHNPLNSRFQRPYINKYPKFLNPYFRPRPFELNTYLDENKNTDSTYASSQNVITSTQRDNRIERNEMEGQNPFKSFGTTSSDKSGNPTLANAYLKSKVLSASSSADENFASDLHVSEQNIPAFEISSESSKAAAAIETTSNSEISYTVYRISSEPEYKSFKKEESLELVEGQSTFSTQTLENSSKDDATVSSTENEETETPSQFVTDIFAKGESADSTFFNKKEEQKVGSTFPKDGSDSSYSTTPETKGTRGYIFSSTKTSSSKETLLPNKENFEKESTIFLDTTSVTTKPLVGKSSSSVDIQSTNSQDTELSSAVSGKPSFSTTDKDIALKIKSSSSEGIHSTNTGNFETESIASHGSTTLTSDDTTSQSKSSSSLGIVSTTTETLENKSTTKNDLPPSKLPLIPSTDEVTEDIIKEISSTVSSSSKTEITPEAIVQDHIIEISSIRTARIVISSVFLVIALTAITILAVYIFSIKRKTVHYDQLLLIQ